MDVPASVVYENLTKEQTEASDYQIGESISEVKQEEKLYDKFVRISREIEELEGQISKGSHKV